MEIPSERRSFAMRSTLCSRYFEHLAKAQPPTWFDADELVRK